jgi:hypothetical protein
MISPEQQERVDELCRMIAVEKDLAKVSVLARELNELLTEKNGTASERKTP